MLHTSKTLALVLVAGAAVSLTARICFGLNAYEQLIPHSYWVLPAIGLATAWLISVRDLSQRVVGTWLLGALLLNVNTSSTDCIAVFLPLAVWVAVRAKAEPTWDDVVAGGLTLAGPSVFCDALWSADPVRESTLLRGLAFLTTGVWLVVGGLCFSRASKTTAPRLALGFLASFPTLFGIAGLLVIEDTPMVSLERAPRSRLTIPVGAFLVDPMDMTTLPSDMDLQEGWILSPRYGPQVLVLRRATQRREAEVWIENHESLIMGYVATCVWQPTALEAVVRGTLLPELEPCVVSR